MCHGFTRLKCLEIGSGVNPCTDQLQTVIFVFGGFFFIALLFCPLMTPIAVLELASFKRPTSRAQAIGIEAPKMEKHAGNICFFKVLGSSNFASIPWNHKILANSVIFGDCADAILEKPRMTHHQHQQNDALLDLDGIRGGIRNKFKCYSLRAFPRTRNAKGNKEVGKCRKQPKSVVPKFRLKNLLSK